MLLWILECKKYQIFSCFFSVLRKVLLSRGAIVKDVHFLQELIHIWNGFTVLCKHKNIVNHFLTLIDASLEELEKNQGMFINGIKLRQMRNRVLSHQFCK